MYTSMTEFNNKLQRYADCIVKVGLNLQKGQRLLIMAPVESADLVRLVTGSAYKLGASLVTTLYRDEVDNLTRLLESDPQYLSETDDWLSEGVKKLLTDHNTCRLVLHVGDTQLLKDVDSSKISQVNKATSTVWRPVQEMVSQFQFNWCIAAYATERWATQVYGTSAGVDYNGQDVKATSLLWNAIFKACRVTGDDWQRQWGEHNHVLCLKAEMMNNADYDALHFKDSTGKTATDLVVGLAIGHKWVGGASQSKNSIWCNPNLPTEEIFTTPHRSKVDGTVCSTKPLYYNGSTIDQITVVFKDGVITEAHAVVGNDILQSLLNSDDGSRRIGEVALVPHSSPISSSGILFKSTLFDENASCHIAIGRSYPKCMFDGDTSREELKLRGANDSVIHVDWMIGSGDIDIDGIKDGVVTPIFRKGEWV